MLYPNFMLVENFSAGPQGMVCCRYPSTAIMVKQQNEGGRHVAAGRAQSIKLIKDVLAKR